MKVYGYEVIYTICFRWRIRFLFVQRNEKYLFSKATPNIIGYLENWCFTKTLFWPCFGVVNFKTGYFGDYLEWLKRISYQNTLNRPLKEYLYFVVFSKVWGLRGAVLTTTYQLWDLWNFIYPIKGPIIRPQNSKYFL